MSAPKNGMKLINRLLDKVGAVHMNHSFANRTNGSKKRENMKTKKNMHSAHSLESYIAMKRDNIAKPSISIK